MGRREHFEDGASGYEHIPPTPEAIAHINNAVMAHKVNQLGEEMGRKDKAVKTAKARNSPFALSSHTAIRKHLKHDHGAWPEDVQKDHGELARWHQSWHADGNEDHAH